MSDVPSTESQEPPCGPARWQVPADAALTLRYWDGECVLFHGAAGDTHRLPEAVGQLLQRLQQVPAAAASELSAAVDLDEQDVELSLAELSRRGIVEPVR
ncbi:MAG: HPr-rel-A system PqqD family peptide chaperone [Burkholderiales bacterium]